MTHNGIHNDSPSNKRVVIVGASGALGRALCGFLSTQGFELWSVGRDVERSRKLIPNIAGHLSLNDEHRAKLIEVMSGCRAVVNLAGASIGELRWTEKNKALMYSSRIKTTEVLAKIITELPQAPSVFVSTSAIGYYGFGHDEIFREENKAGSDFLARLCADWETAASPAKKLCRVVHPRIGVVFDTEAGALAKLLPLFRLGIGGPLGSGKQWMSWVHHTDLIRALHFCIVNEQVQGAINCVAPHAVRMNELASILAKTLHRPAIFRVPTFVLRLVLGEQHVIVTEGQHVSSERIESLGFSFEFPNCDICVNNLTQS